MPLFERTEGNLKPIEQTNFDKEKDLQTLVESNLGVIFNCRFVASEFSTGSLHGGRIDTLALSEENNPVIIEYKRVESSDLINQSLFYLAWIQDHKGDFEVAVQKTLGPGIAVDWSDVRVLCIAPNFKKYDLHAVQVMGADLELWAYRTYTNGALYLEEVFQKSMKSVGGNTGSGTGSGGTGGTPPYTFEYHLQYGSEGIQHLATALQEFIMGLDPAMEEAPKKTYVAYKISQNIACMEIQKKQVILYLKLDPKTLGELPPIAQDVSNIGHIATGDLKVAVKTEADLEPTKALCERAYQRVGG